MVLYLPSMTLICVQCKKSIDHNSIRFHMRKHGKIDSSTLSSLEISLEPYPLIYPPVYPGEAIDSIAYLHDPLPGYLICQTCFQGFQKPSTTTPSKSMSEHACFTRPESCTWIEGYTQTFLAGPSARRFQVKSSKPDLVQHSSNAYTEYKAQMDAREPTAMIAAKEDNYRLFNHFLQSEGWLEHVDNLDETEIKSLVTLPTMELKTVNLAKHCYDFLLYWQETLTDYHAQRLIGSRPTQVFILFVYNHSYLTIFLL